MTTNITSRHLKIIIITVIVLLLLYYIIPKDWLLKLNPAKGKYIKINQVYGNMLQNFKNYDYLEKEKSSLLDEINKINIDTKILQEEIIINLHKHCMENNIVITKINFSEVVPAYLNNDEENLNEDSEKEAASVNVTVEFKSNYHNMLEFVDGIKNSDMNIAVINMRVLTPDDSDIIGVMDLNFYAMPLH